MGRGRPKLGKGTRVVSVTVEIDLLRRADAYARKAGLKRAELFTQGPFGSALCRQSKAFTDTAAFSRRRWNMWIRLIAFAASLAVAASTFAPEPATRPEADLSQGVADRRFGCQRVLPRVAKRLEGRMVVVSPERNGGDEAPV